MDDFIISILASLLALYFLLSIIIVHVARRDLSFVKTPLSQYALGRKSSYLTIGFILIGFSEIIIALILRDNILAALNLFLAGLGVIIVGIVKMDEKNKKSLQNMIHNFGVILQFLCFPIALSLFSLSTDNNFISIYHLVIALITFSLFIFIFGFYKKYIQDQISYYGLLQKINILLINFWLIITPILLLS